MKTPERERERDDWDDPDEVLAEPYPTDDDLSQDEYDRRIKREQTGMAGER